MVPPIVMHINYCEQGQSIEEATHKAVDWGFDGVEFRRQRTGVTETPEQYLDTVAGAAEKFGLKYVLFGSPGPDLTKPNVEQRRHEVQDAVRFFRLAAQRVELTVCNTFTGPLLNPARNVPYRQYAYHGSFCARQEQWNWAVEGFRPLGDVAAELGFKLAFETHMCYLHDLPSAAKKLVDRIDRPAVGVNLDYGNAVWFPDNPCIKDTIESLGDRLYYVHLKNSVPLPGGGHIPTGLGDGQINHREYLRLLQASGYDGPLCIESPRPGDREAYAPQDIGYLKTVLADIGWQ